MPPPPSCFVMLALCTYPMEMGWLSAQLFEHFKGTKIEGQLNDFDSDGFHRKHDSKSQRFTLELITV